MQLETVVQQVQAETRVQQGQVVTRVRAAWPARQAQVAWPVLVVQQAWQAQVARPVQVVAPAVVPKQTPTVTALPMPWIIVPPLPIPIRKMVMATALVMGAIPILRAPMCAFQDNSVPSAVAP